MRNLSLWAKQNVAAARVLIFAIHVLLILLAFFISSHIQFNFSLIALMIILIVLGINIFIDKYHKKKTYVIKKSIHFITSVCFFLIICFLIKHNLATGYFQHNMRAASIQNETSNKNLTAQQILESLKYRDKGTLTKQEKHTLKKEFKKQLTAYGKSTSKHDSNGAIRALLIILAIIGAAGLTILLAGLACSISCSGSGALAILVFVLGFAGIAFGFYFLIKGIGRTKKTKPADNNITTLNDTTMPTSILL